MVACRQPLAPVEGPGTASDDAVQGDVIEQLLVPGMQVRREAELPAEADKVFRVKDRLPWLMHFELQVSYDPDLPQRMLRYNVLLKNRHGLPVRSVGILLHPRADGPELTGVVRHTLADEQYLEFNYRVVRIWQKPVEAVLAAGVGTLALSPLTQSL